MFAVAPTGSPPSTLAAAGDCAYVGYRPPRGAATLRLPSGEYAVLARGDDQAVAEAVLADRLGPQPDPALLEAFGREWVAGRARGEFVWPVAAVDEWLATTAERLSPAPCRRSGTRRALGSLLPVLPTPLAAAPHTPSPRGGR